MYRNKVTATTDRSVDGETEEPEAGRKWNNEPNLKEKEVREEEEEEEEEETRKKEYNI
jgi:hypothetical protein